VRFDPLNPPRVFRVGGSRGVELRDCGKLHLEPGEQVALIGERAVHDVTWTPWGFYATAALNSRLPGSGLRPPLAQNKTGKFFVLLFQDGFDAEFERNLEQEGLQVVCWLDDETALARIVDAVRAADPHPPHAVPPSDDQEAR
jgi:hypothetical protein